MKQFSTYIILAIITITSFTACNKAISDEFVSYPNNPLNDTAWTTGGNNALANNKLQLPEMARNIAIDSFDYTIENKISFGDSIQIYFPANACSNINGAPITSSGKVKIEIILLKKRGDFVKNAAATTNVLALLEAGIYCDIKLTKNGQEVLLNPNNQVKIKVKDSTANNDMKFFIGNPIKYYKDSIFSWAPSQDGQVSIWKDNNGSSASKTIGYELTTKRIRWFGTSKYADSTAAKTRLNVTLPPNYTNKNTTVFAVLKTKNTVASFFSDAATKSFFTLNMPVSAEVTLVSISNINNSYYLGNQSFRVTNANPVNMLPEKKTLVQILDFLDKL
jgi:hypothetical protein